MRIVGLDLSLNSTGVALPSGATLRHQPRCTGVERLAWHRDAIAAALAANVVDLAVLEGYAYGRHNGAAALGELGGVVRLALADAGVPVVVVPPAALKLYATGKGNASKDEVFAAAIRRLDYEGSSNDECDALWLRAMGMDACGEPVTEVPGRHREALAKVAWPVARAGAS